jgi:hypothetical protein
MALAAISQALLGNEQTMLTVLTQILKPFLSRIGIGFAREGNKGLAAAAAAESGFA